MFRDAHHITSTAHISPATSAHYKAMHVNNFKYQYEFPFKFAQMSLPFRFLVVLLAAIVCHLHLKPNFTPSDKYFVDLPCLFSTERAITLWVPLGPVFSTMCSHLGF